MVMPVVVIAHRSASLSLAAAAVPARLGEVAVVRRSSVMIA